MSIVFSNVDCEVYNNSVRESFTREGGLTASVTLRCLWTLRSSLVNDLIYNRRVWPYTVNNINPPIVSSVSITQERPCAGQSGQGYDYNVADAYALCEVQYESIQAGGDTPAQDSPVDYDILVETLDTNVEFLTQAPQSLVWNNGKPVKEEVSPTVRIWGLNYSRQYIGVTGTLPDEVFTNIGKCNTTAQNSKYYGYTFAIETLLYNGANIERTFTALGEVRLNVTLNFQWQEQTWNKFWNPDIIDATVTPNIMGDWDTMEDANGNIYKPIKPASFANLFF